MRDSNRDDQAKPHEIPEDAMNEEQRDFPGAQSGENTGPETGREMSQEADQPTGQMEAVPLPLPENVMRLPSAERGEKLRVLEALLFAATEPLDEARLAEHIPEGEDIRALIDELQAFYAGRGINLVGVAGKWTFRTADDLSFLLQRYAVEQRRLSRAALETLSIISYHQPVTRAEIEEIRGVATSKGTIDVLLETNWIKLRGRRRVPGRPITYGTTQTFLEHFGFDDIKDLPGLDELKGAGLLDGNLPPGFSVPMPDDSEELAEDEDPLEDDPLEGDLLEGGPLEGDPPGSEHLADEFGGGEGGAETQTITQD